MQYAEAALEHRELDHGEEVHGELLEARAEAAVFLEAADDALDDVPLPIGGPVDVRMRTLIAPRAACA
jgi:hypothetical protein